MRLGILDTIGLAMTVIFAFPVANFGVNRLLAGEILTGSALLVVAVAMVAVPHYFTDPRTVLRRLFGGLLPAGVRNDSSTPAEIDDPPER